MDFALSPKAAGLTAALEAVYQAQMREAGGPHYQPPVLEELKQAARDRGLWNLFLPHKSDWSEGLSNLDYAPLAEISGRSLIAPEVLNCPAPDTGSMELLTLFGTDEQKERWLAPLLSGGQPRAAVHDPGPVGRPGGQGPPRPHGLWLQRPRRSLRGHPR